jgi:hypothetical protein
MSVQKLIQAKGAFVSVASSHVTDSTWRRVPAHLVPNEAHLSRFRVGTPRAKQRQSSVKAASKQRQSSVKAASKQRERPPREGQEQFWRAGPRI